MMLAELDDWDWKEAFGYVGESGTCAGGPCVPMPVEGSGCAATAATREDVAEIIAMDPGENDGPEWVGIFRLKDGRWLYLEAGCDYTGWDCQAGGSGAVADALPALWLLGVGDESRRRLRDKAADRLRAEGAEP